MNAHSHQQDWEDLATVDPLWAILSDPSKRFRHWERDEFFETGAQEIAHVIHKARRLCSPRTYERALDFGCGVGRLTRAIRPHFRECFGVDISESMIRKARELNHDCKFLVNVEWNLRMFPDCYFDFVYSSLVLQHQPDRGVIIGHIGELLRVLRKNGLLVFQLPSHIPWRNRLQPRRRLWALLRSVGLRSDLLYNRLKLCPIRMNWIRQDEIVRHITRFGGLVVDIEPIQQEGEPFVSCVYYCTT